MANIDGTPGDDIDPPLEGGGGPDVIRGFEGDDILEGHGGDDILKGGPGHDILKGGKGSDTLDGGGGGDWIHYSGNLAGIVATFMGEASGTVVENATDTDTFTRIEGIGGTDFADTFTNTGSSYARFRGLGGVDHYTGNPGGVDEIDFVKDADFGGTAGVTVNLTTNTATDGFGNAETMSSIEDVRGTNEHDDLTGNSSNNRLDGAGGADFLKGLAGDDTYVVDDGGDQAVESDGGGTDTIESSISLVLPAFVENLTLVAGDISGTGNDLANYLTGSEGDNHMSGLDGADTLIGGLGNDDLDGGANPEVGQPGAQGDIMLGGEGNDTYHVDSGLDLVDEGSYFAGYGFGGSDTIISTTDFYWDIASVGETDIVSEDVVDAGGDGVTIVGGVFDNTLIGHSGTDVLFGRGGNDTYRAGDGVDFISLSTLGVTDTSNYTADGHNTIIVDPRTSGPFSYDIVFEFDPAKDKIDVSNYTGVHDYTSADEVLSHAVDDGAGNCYIVLGDGLDYLYLVGIEKADLLASDFIV